MSKMSQNAALENQAANTKARTIAINGLIAALYIAITGVIAPFAFGAVQFRVPEIFNHLVVFNKRYFFGVVIGVFFANLFFSTLLPYDLIFGVLHSVISLGITIFVGRFIKNVWARMAINTIAFSVLSIIIAYELEIALELSKTGLSVWMSWLWIAIGELVVMGIGTPIMYAINKKVNFKKLV